MTYAMHPFTLHHPNTVEEALALSAEHPGALYLAGGTDLMVNLRKRLHEPHHVVNLAGIEGLRGVAREGAQLTIGALTTIETLAADPLVREHLPVLAGAAALVAGPTLRGMGTLGGNLCLDTRCRYYNQSHFWRQANDFCLKKDGDVCHVAPGRSGSARHDSQREPWISPDTRGGSLRGILEAQRGSRRSEPESG